MKGRKENYLIQYLAAASGSLGAITSGMHAGWPSPSLHKLLSEDSTIPITNAEGSSLAIIFLIGGIVGSIAAMVISKYLGRKTVMLISSVPHFISWVLIASAESVTALYIARIIAGVAEGLTYSAFPMYCGEMSDPKIRGLISSTTSALYVFGILLINIIGLNLSIRVTALVASTLPVLLFLTFIWLPESPYYLLTKDRVEEAKKCLKTFRRKSDIDVELNRMHQGITEENKSSQNILDLFKIATNRKTLLVMVMLRTVQQCTGAIPITFYAKSIFSVAGDDDSSNISTIVFFTIQFVLSIFTSVIVDRTGRRPLLIISMSGACVALFIEGTYFFIKNCMEIDTSDFNFIQVTALIAFVISLSLGLQTVPLLMFSEVFSTHFKPYALCVVTIWYSIVATILSKFFQITKDNFGIHVPFFAFAGCCVGGLVFIIFYIPETKGKTLEEIQEQLKIKRKSTIK